MYGIQSERRPLIDSVRSDLQELLERAAESTMIMFKPLYESDTKTTTHNEPDSSNVISNLRQVNASANTTCLEKHKNGVT